MCSAHGKEEMADRMEEISGRYEEILNELKDPSAASDPGRMTALLKELSRLKPVVETNEALLALKRHLSEDEALLTEEDDEEMKSLLKEEISGLQKAVQEKAEELKMLLIPRDPKDDRSVVLEIRSGTGGDEAALFAADLFRMYSRYAERRGWKMETTEYNASPLGGVNKVTAIVNGKGAWSALKHESGIHRVQRVPKTESQGRIQTSACTVAVLPEAEEVDVEIRPEDIRFDVFRASGNGGQCVNTTDSAVRLTHYPTGIVISCQDEKSQLKNRDKAMKVLRARLYELEQQKKHDEEAAVRKNQVGSGDRSEKIRTYNFPQGRVTDHRIGLDLYKIWDIMDGDLQELTEALQKAEETEKLIRA